jgi:hypothetical protein
METVNSKIKMLDGSVSGESQSLIPNDTWDATSSGGDKF